MKLGYKSVALFENGIIFNKNRDESRSLGFVFSGEKESESVANAGKPKSIDFFGFSQKIVNIIDNFELEPMKKITNNFIHPYQNANILIDKKIVGNIYKLHPNIAKDFDIPNDTFLANINFDMLDNQLIKASFISKYQSSKRDLSIVTPKSMKYKEIKKVLNSLNIQEIKQFNLIDVYTDEKLGDNESLTIKFILQSDEKTLEENDIVSIMDRILKALEDKLDLCLRQ
jgi:phenylalanyl-tRNA synthetase beta chain